MKESFAKFVVKQRLRPYQLALCVLLVGWVPSLLLAYYSYNVLGRTLESKIKADAESLVASLAQHIETEIVRTGETMDYYRTLPVTASLLAPSPAAAAGIEVRPAAPVGTTPAPAVRHGRSVTGIPGHGVETLAPAVIPTAPPVSAQDWLAGIFYPQVNRIDGLFLTDATGKLVATVPPPIHGEPAREFTAAPWKAAAERLDPDGAGFHVSPVYPRSSDGRQVVSVVVAVRDKTGKDLLGFFGADILVERLGKRLRSVAMISDHDTSLQIIDGAGQPLFTRSLEPSPPNNPGIDPALLRAYRHRKEGIEESNGNLHVFAAIPSTGWTAVLERPADALLQPVHNLLSQTMFLVGWLVVGTLVAAVLLTSFYRRQLMSSLRTEREQIFNEKILANMPVGIALIDPAGEHFLHVNSVFVDIVRSLGTLPREAVVSRATFGEVAVASREAFARVLHFGVPFQAIEQRTPTGTGQVRFLTTNLLRLQDNQQRTIGVLCLIEDNTSPVNLRQELINANTAKDQFLAQLSHELRNPLSPVITMVAELEAHTAALPAARQPLEIIRRNVELEARLIDDLLDVTRISSGKLQLSRETVDVHRILRLALEICQREIDDKALRFELDLRAREFHAEADPARLQQVFWNLIKNAVKFTPGGRRLTVRSINFTGTSAMLTRPGQTHVQFAHVRPPSTVPSVPPSPEAAPAAASLQPAVFLRIEVCDEGIGIESQHLRRIFNAFDQGQSSITQRFGGLGLGLAISKAMVEAHGGTLSVASNGVDQGATFTVDLHTCLAPASAAPAVSANGGAKAAAPTPTDGEGRRVLLVDDHLDTCLGMQRLLQRRGYRVVVAHSVAEGLAKAESEEAFDLLISDLGLPDGSGFDLMAELRRRGGPPGIALSGYGMESDIDKSRQAGFSEHLIKPVAIDRLEDVMGRLLAADA